MGRLAMGMLTKNNLGQAKVILKQAGISPETEEKVFSKAVTGDYSGLAYFNDIPVAVILSHKFVPPSSSKEVVIVIEAASVLPVYRGKYDIEKTLIEHVLNASTKVKATRVVFRDSIASSDYLRPFIESEFEKVDHEDDDLSLYVPSDQISHLELYMKSLEIS